MSRFSGKCDLYDLLMSMHRRCKNGSDKKEDLENASVLYSDEYECFLEFKEKTKGTIYQHKRVEVNEQNQKLIAEKCNGDLEIIELPLEGKQRKHKYVYRYKDYDQGYEYKSLKELNKVGVYITLEIHFDTILDLIPYYPYTTGLIFSDNEKMTVYISNQPYTVEERDSLLNNGYDGQESYEYYIKKLQAHYGTIVKLYYNSKPENHRIERVLFDDTRQARTIFPIDDRFVVKWFFVDGDHNHDKWCQPKVIDYEKGLIEISELDYNNFIGKECYVNYYKYEKPKLYLD